MIYWLLLPLLLLLLLLLLPLLSGCGRPARCRQE
jgi:hypothetical protein